MDTLVLAYVLIAVGLVLLIAELFIPSFGILTVMAVCMIAGGVLLTYYYGDSSTFIATVIGLVIVLPAMATFMLYYWPRSRFGRTIFQGAPEETSESLVFSADLEKLRGRLGKALSALRPAGVADFDNRRVDVITEGMMVDAGTWVRCIDVKGGRVIVRPVEAPDLGDLENADFT